MDGISEFNMISTGIKTTAMLFIVLGFLILILYLIKRFLFIRKEVKGNLAIKVLSSLHLSSKERVEVVEICGERIVLGIAPGRINYLIKLSDSNGETEK